MTVGNGDERTPLVPDDGFIEWWESEPRRTLNPWHAAADAWHARDKEIESLRKQIREMAERRELAAEYYQGLRAAAQGLLEADADPNTTAGQWTRAKRTLATALEGDGTFKLDTLPWNRPELAGWEIVGMNHYHVKGKRCLFVAMTRDRRCITAEGSNEQAVFGLLVSQALIVDA